MKRKAIAFAIVGLLIIGVMSTTFSFDLSVKALAQRGPRIDFLRYKIVRAPAAALCEMTVGPASGSDVWSDMTRPTDVEEMDRQDKTLSSRSGLNYVGIVINMRVGPLSDVNFRHALAHLIPKSKITTNVYKWIAATINTPVPPAQGSWYNPTVDPHAYSPDEAKQILEASGYVKDKKTGVWKYSDGSALPTLRLYSPLLPIDTDAWTTCSIIEQELHDFGLDKINQYELDHATLLDRTYDQWDFELSYISHSLGTSPTHLFHQFSSENNFQGSSNPHGINYGDLDTQLSIFWRSLDSSAVKSAALESQKLIMGGTTSTPLPQHVSPTDPRHESIPIIPIHVTNNYAAQQPELRGAVNMMGVGIASRWSLMNMYWKTDGNYRPNTSEKSITWIEGDYPETMNPLFARLHHTWDLMEMSYDGLIETNPYTQRDVPWLAASWSVVAVPEGMDVTINLNLTGSESQPVTWQDGKAVTVDDVKFSWDFLHDWVIPNYWSSMRFYDPSNTVIVDSDTIRVRMTTTSPWLIGDLASTALLLPPQVWKQDPRDGLNWTHVSEIMTFDPSAYVYPLPGNYYPGGYTRIALPTQLFGTGPFILTQSRASIVQTQQCNLAANRNYWKTTLDIQNVIENMFWRAGDCLDNDKVDVADLDFINQYYGQTVPPADELADITGPAGSPPDGYVDIDDLATAGKYFGETETVPYEHETPPP